MVVDDAKAADLVGRGEGMKNGRSAKSLKAGGPRGQELAPLCDDNSTFWAGVHSHKCLEMDPAKKN